MGSDTITSASKIGLNQNYREGKPASLTGLIPYVKAVDAYYPFLTHGRDLQHDIIHPRDIINASKDVNGVSEWDKLTDTWKE